MNRRAFIIAATLPALFQSCRPEQAMGQERDLTLGERIQIVDESIRRCVLPSGWTVVEVNGSYVQPVYGSDFLTPVVGAYEIMLAYRWQQFGGSIGWIDASPLLRDAHLPSIDHLVERALLDAVERFEGEKGVTNVV